MKKITIILSFFIIAVSCNTGSQEEKSEKTTVNENLTAVKYEISIEGMTCTGCEETIEGGVMKIEGVKSIEADHTEGKAIVEFFSEKTDTTAISKSIIGSGYTVKGFKPGSME